MAINQTGLLQNSQQTSTPYFIGFSTVDKRSPPYTLTNIDLIKRDLQNQFATPLGSRVMLPNFGSIIHELVFDPLDDYTKNAIIDDATRVVQSDPRVQLISIDAYQSDYALNVVMTLLFNPESVTDNLFVTFSLTDQDAF